MNKVLGGLAFVSLLAFGSGCAAPTAGDEAESVDGTEAQGLTVTPIAKSPNLPIAFNPKFVLSGWSASLPAGFGAPVVLDAVSAGACLIQGGYAASTDPNQPTEYKVFVKSVQDARSGVACERTGYLVVGKSYDPPAVDVASRPTGTPAASTDFVVGWTRKSTPLCDPVFDYPMVSFTSVGFVRRNARVVATGVGAEIESGVVNVVSVAGTVTVHGKKQGVIAGEVLPVGGSYVDGTTFKAVFGPEMFTSDAAVLAPSLVEAY